MHQDNLLPCPFCNRPVSNDPAISSIGDGYTSQQQYYWWIECEYCYIVMEEWFGPTDDPDLYRSIIIKRWNTRVSFNFLTETQWITLL
jgi:hypothetical protein